MTHFTQTFVLRLLIDLEEGRFLKGMLHNVSEDADYPFENDEELLHLLHQLTNQKKTSRRSSNLREENSLGS